MRTLLSPFAKAGGSLVALAAALAVALPAVPAAAQDVDSPRSARAERPSPRAEVSGGRQRVDMPRPDSRPAPRFERRAAPVAEAAPARPASRGFGGEVADRVRAAREMTSRGPRAGRDIERGDVRSAPGRGIGQPGGAWQGRPRDGSQVGTPGGGRGGRPDGWRGDRPRDAGPSAGSGGWQGPPRGGRGGAPQGGVTDGRTDGGQVGSVRTGRGERDWRDGRRDGGFGSGVRDAVREGRRTDGWRGDRDGRGEWRGDRDGRGEWRGDRDGRGQWRGDRQNWRRDDWRWGWNGRPGWDRRDFRRWDNRWRYDRRYDWNDFRRGNRFVFRPGPYYAPYRSHRYSRLSIGVYLDSLFFQPRFFITDPWAYRLPPVYGPYQWVRYYDDVLLVDIYTGEVVDVINDFFW